MRWPASSTRSAATEQSRPPADAGAAVVDFVFVSVLILFLLFGVVQVGVYFYARNIAAAAAADGARHAAAAGVPVADGALRAEALIRHGLDDADAAAIRCTSTPAFDAASRLATVQVHCRGRLRLLFVPLPIPLTVDVTAAVLKEGTP